MRGFLPRVSDNLISKILHPRLLLGPVKSMNKPPICFQLKHIGDFLNTLPSLGLLKKNFPSQPIGVVVTPKIAELASAHPWVDDVFIIDKNSGLDHLLGVSAEIDKKAYDSSLIFDGQTRSIVTSFLAGLKNRIGASGLYPVKGWQGFLYTHDLEIRTSPLSLLSSQAERGVRMTAASLGLEVEKPLRPPMPEISPAQVAAAKSLMAELKGDGPLIGLTLQGLQPEKSWPMANFAALAKKLWSEFQARLFVTGATVESRSAEVLAQSSGVPVGNFCGRTSLLELVALADMSDLFITVDTGTSHLVALTNTPLISIFIWTSPALWPPQTPNLRILCYNWSLARFGLRPEDGPWRAALTVDPEMVLEEAVSIFKR